MHYIISTIAYNRETGQNDPADYIHANYTHVQHTHVRMCMSVTMPSLCVFQDAIRLQAKRICVCKPFSSFLLYFLHSWDFLPKKLLHFAFNSFKTLV